MEPLVALRRHPRSCNRSRVFGVQGFEGSPNAAGLKPHGDMAAVDPYGGGGGRVVLQQDLAETYLHLTRRMFAGAVETWGKKNGSTIFEASVKTLKKELASLVVSPMDEVPGETSAEQHLPARLRRALQWWRK